RRRQDAAARAPDRLGVGECALLRAARSVLVDGEQARHAAAGAVGAAHEVAGALRRDHEAVDGLGRGDLVEVDVEAVGERQGVAGLEVRLDLLAVDAALYLVGQEDHHDVAGRGGVGDLHHPKPGRLGRRPRVRAAPEADDDVAAGVAGVEGVGVALGAVADDRDRLALEVGEVRVGVVEDLRHALYLLSASSREALVMLSRPNGAPGDGVGCRARRERARRGLAGPGSSSHAAFARPLSCSVRSRATMPVRTSSTIPNGRIWLMKAPSLPSSPVTSNVRASLATSTMRALKSCAICLISTLSSGVLTATLMSISSRPTYAEFEWSTTVRTSMSFWSCFVTCSTVVSSPVTTNVVRERPGRSVCATESDSML